MKIDCNDSVIKTVAVSFSVHRRIAQCIPWVMSRVVINAFCMSASPEPSSCTETVGKNVSHFPTWFQANIWEHEWRSVVRMGGEGDSDSDSHSTGVLFCQTSPFNTEWEVHPPNTYYSLFYDRFVAEWWLNVYKIGGLQRIHLFSTCERLTPKCDVCCPGFRHLIKL